MPRPYSSELRSARSRETRAAVLSAAQALFERDGWTATTMAAVADRAGVTRQTVYAMFESKLSLLDECVDRSLRGDDDGGSIRERPAYQQIGVGELPERIGAGAHWLREAHQRSAAIQRIVDEAAVTDPAAADHLVAREAARWQEMRFALGLVLGRTDPPDALVDEIWTLGSRDVWRKLVVQRGWSPEQWQNWFAATLERAIRAADLGPGRAF